MDNTSLLVNRIFSLTSNDDFDQLALDIFVYQYFNNPLYGKYCKLLGANPSHIHTPAEIPFLPVEFFRSHKIISGIKAEEVVFTSSGTTGNQTSSHYVVDTGLYERSFGSAFRHFYGEPSEWCVLALLPSYLERSGSSLVFMATKLIRDSLHPDSGFYLHNLDDLAVKLEKLKLENQKTLLLGVTYALLDLAEHHQIDFPSLVVMETGGMKGHRKELIREELHSILNNGFGTSSIHSEYGMTELLSQAYSSGNGRFFCPPWMKVLIRDTNDPLSYVLAGKTGGINVIDLANIHSCSFISVQDLGKWYENGSFEVLGRFDNSQVRGCNLLIQ